MAHTQGTAKEHLSAEREDKHRERNLGKTFFYSQNELGLVVSSTKRMTATWGRSLRGNTRRASERTELRSSVEIGDALKVLKKVNLPIFRTEKMRRTGDA